jgi:hypothetical protein
MGTCLGSDAELAAFEAGEPLQRRIGDRYQVVGELGRGGMACVYRVLDISSGYELALKQLLRQPDEKRAHEAALLFEREFHTLTQLSHPRLIEVSDYGVDAAGPYYTMELLDGGDLRELSPLPWRRACELIFDVCSSLALLHSRRLVHRDVSPRNVRCTRDGHAKLIDFGAMAQLGSSAALVGTPPFVAPEAVHGLPLDARADLFSLGNTLYFALTGRLAYPARDFSQLLESWSNKPAPPSALVADVPAALDRLVLSLISLEAALRPRSAFEVMQRLAAVAGIEREEPLSVADAYLVTPALVGRDAALLMFGELLQKAQHGRGRGVLIEAPPGYGRSRILEACVLRAQMSGACVVRASALGTENSPFALARKLADQLLCALPQAAPAAARSAEVFDVLFDAPAHDSTPRLRGFERAASERAALSRALLKWLVQLSRERLLTLAVDDVEQADDASLALLALLAERARRHSLLVVVTAIATPGEAKSPRLEVLDSRCARIALDALAAPEIEALLSSVFGDVPNIALLAARIHATTLGSPRHAMALAQHLVARGAISYDGGTWTLPEQLSEADLPASAQHALRARIASLSPLARRLADAHALVPNERFSEQDYALLEPAAAADALRSAVDELVARQLLTREAGRSALAHRELCGLLSEALADSCRSELQKALAHLYRHTGRPAFGVARLLLSAGEQRQGLDELLSVVRGVRDRAEFRSAARVDGVTAAQTVASGLRQALALGYSARDCHDLRQCLVGLSVENDEAVYWDAAPEWRAQLERDSGLLDYRALASIEDPAQRLTTALQTVAARHAAQPEAERVYSPEEAIRGLVQYVALSIAIGARAVEMRLLMSLPELLEPFANLSPVLHAVWQNAIATVEWSCWRQTEQPRARWLQVYERLGTVEGSDPQLLRAIRLAIAFGIGLMDASRGLESAQHWAELLDHDPLQHVNAMYLRKIVRLQQGDLEGAERCRKQAELLALQSSTRQMFTNLLMLELGVHAAAWDLTGVKQIAQRIEPLAERHAGWVPFRHLAEGHYQRLRGDLEAACAAYVRCIALSAPDPSEPYRPITAWPLAVAAYSEVLVALERAGEAQPMAAATLAACAERGIVLSAQDVSRALALVEAKLGEYAQAAQRLDTLLEQLRAAGVTGMLLGLACEARARIAIWAGDQPALERFSRLTAEQYRHGRGSLLGVRYERLMDEARVAGAGVLPAPSLFETTIFGSADFGPRATAMSTVITIMTGAHDRDARAQRALKLLCDARHAPLGHLYLADAGGLRLAASSGEAAPDDMLQRLVSDFWSQQCDDEGPDTAMLSEGDSATQLWTDQRGTGYRPLLLLASSHGVPVTAGVAVLAHDAADACDDRAAVLAMELASFLTRAGDSVAKG